MRASVHEAGFILSPMIVCRHKLAGVLSLCYRWGFEIAVIGIALLRIEGERGASLGSGFSCWFQLVDFRVCFAWWSFEFVCVTDFLPARKGSRSG